jgi:hypothetical protein
MSKMMKQEKPPYKGHMAMCCDKQTSEHGTSTAAGKSKVTEGRGMESPVGRKGPHGKGSKKGTE